MTTDIKITDYLSPRVIDILCAKSSGGRTVIDVLRAQRKMVTAKGETVYGRFRAGAGQHLGLTADEIESIISYVEAVEVSR